MRRLLFTVVSALLLLGRAPAAVVNVDCRDPRIFPGAAVNTVILPYEYIGSQVSSERSAAAQRLGIILQRDILLSLLRYSSIATVQMINPRGSSGRCDPDTIANQLLGRQGGASETVRPGNGLVLLWGVLYEEGDALYVRSFLRYIRNVPAGDEVNMQLGTFKFSAAVPLEAVAFPPVRMLTSDLLAIEQIFRQSSILRSSPGEDGSKSEIPFDPNFPFAYAVEEARDGWIRVRALRDGPSGWIHAAAQIGQSSLRTKMPELNFIVSAVGYLQALIAKASGRTADLTKNLGLSRQALSDFQNAGNQEDAPEAAAAAKSLSARLWILGGSDASRWKSAVDDLDIAIKQNPSDPSLRNFRAICRAWLVYHNSAPYSAAGIAEDLKDAATQSPDPRILDNLAALYRAMLTTPRLRQANDTVVRSELSRVETIRTARKK